MNTLYVIFFVGFFSGICIPIFFRFARIWYWNQLISSATLCEVESIWTKLSSSREGLIRRNIGLKLDELILVQLRRDLEITEQPFSQLSKEATEYYRAEERMFEVFSEYSDQRMAVKRFFDGGLLGETKNSRAIKRIKGFYAGN